MDAPRPLISVVIPCYNHAGFLAEALATVIARDFPLEIIVVDDGSIDDSAAVARQFAGVKLIRQENRGLAGARNRGLAECTGPFVIFLDADDRFLPGGIDSAASALLAQPACAMAYGRCVMMGPDGALWPTPEQPVVTDAHYAALLRINPIWMPAMAIFRRDALQRVGGFRSGFDAAADYDLYLRIARDSPIYDHARLVAAYRKHGASMSGSAARMLRETLAVMRRNKTAAVSAGLLDVWRQGYAGWQDFYGTQLVEEMRAHWRAGELSVAIRKTFHLAWYAPRILLRELRRMIRARYAGRATPAAETSAPKRRAET